MHNSPIRILIVEESSTQALRLQYILEQNGYQASIAGTGQETLDTLKQSKPALVISEVVMSDMDGYQLCRQIKTNDASQDVLVILLVSLLDAQDMIRGLESGADNFIAKPYHDTFLLSRIRDTLTNQQLQPKGSTDIQSEIVFNGKKYCLSSENFRILGLLLSAYGTAVQRNRELNQTMITYFTLLENCSDAVVVIDQSEMIRFVNPAAEQLFDKTGRELIGTPFECSLTNSNPREETISRHDGTSINAEMRVVAMDWQGENAYLVLLRDTTEQRQAQLILRQARETTDSAYQAKSTFLATMSHEIRTPMNAVIGMTSLLLDTDLSSQQQDYIETIRNSGDALLTIINNILDFSEIESGKIKLETQTFNLRECVENALDLMVMEAEQKGIEVGTLITADTPAIITGDSSRLYQILVNLLSNAIKFTHQGEIIISVSAEAVPSSSLPPLPDTDEGEKYLLHFIVQDTGIGIPKDRVESIFRSFTQADGSTTRQYGGMGLGLAICKRLTGLMGGDIWVESEEGKGSQFHFTLQTQAAEANLPVYLDRDQPILKNKRILIVDDNATNRQILIRQAQLWEMHPFAVSSGKEALEYIRQGEPFDVGVLDMLMPGMDGLMLADEIRRYRNAKDLPLVMLSSSSRGEIQDDPRMNHFTAHLTKPAKSSRLYNTIIDLFADEVAKQRQQERALQEETSLFDSSMAERLPLRLLLTEDSLTNQKLALHLLQRLGYRADVAGNGREAVEAVHQRPYDIILMDMQMPEMDGLEATRRIRDELPPERQPQIIALTANAMQGDRETCLEAGMNDYMSKPIRVEELTQILGKSHPLEQKAVGSGQKAEGNQQKAEDSEQKAEDPRNEKQTEIDNRQSSLPAVIDHKSLDRLLEMTGDASFVTELIESYLSNSPQLLIDLRQSFEKGDEAGFRMAAHTLKSSSADFGAITLSEYCKELEVMGKAGQLERAAELVEKAEREYERVRPALEALQPGEEKEEEPHEESTVYHGHILVVDDYPVNRQKLSRLLEQQGHTISVAENGKQAIEIIRQQVLDLVLLDIIMPEMDGYQVLEYLREQNILQNLPVIVVSALDEMESVIKCIEMGAEDYLPKPFDPVLLKARIDASLEKKRLHDLEIERQEELRELNNALEVRNQFIRKTFGRYLSDDIVDTILESPEGLVLGGEKRTATIMMTDLRGFTAIGERLPAETVVSMLNIYFNVMTEILFKYQGTIDEFLGDAILAIFGAPIFRDDDAQRAVACALEMQQAMEDVNMINRRAGYPEVAMGIGINTGDVVVGNIGSKKRTKYGVVGRNVNLTSRIESYTVGGQIMISEDTLNACGSILRIDSQMEVMPKGVKDPITIYEIGGIWGNFNIFLPDKTSIELIKLPTPTSIEFTILEGKHASEEIYSGYIVKLTENEAEIEAQRGCRELTNLKISVFDHQNTRVTEDLYAKVKEVLSESPAVFRIHFTSVPPETKTFFKGILSSSM